MTDENLAGKLMNMEVACPAEEVDGSGQLKSGNIRPCSVSGFRCAALVIMVYELVGKFFARAVRFVLTITNDRCCRKWNPCQLLMQRNMSSWGLGVLRRGNV